MKKIAIFALVVSTLISANAGTVTWISGPLKIPNEDGSFSDTVIGNTASVTIYLVSADDYSTYSAMSSADLYNAHTAGTIANTEKKTGASNGFINSANVTTDTTFDKRATAYAVAIYTTTLNGTDYYISNVGYSSINDVDAAVGEASSYLAINSNLTNGGVAGKWTAVPEPTTVALLAIGMAALGLRRKIA